MTAILKILDGLQTSEVTIIASATGILASAFLLRHFLKPSTTRIYENKASVGNEYDQWADDGVLEHFWGEHIHHGYFGSSGKDKIPSIAAKEILIEKLIGFAELEKAPKNGSVRVLDIGCGIGGSSRYLAKRFLKGGVSVETFGVTLSDRQVFRAKQLSVEAGLEANCNFQKADALALPFDDNQFDIVWALESGEHMPDKERFFLEAYRVLKPGGKLMIATWCTKDKNLITANEDYSLGIIYKEWALPFFISISEYESIFSKAGLTNYKTADWSIQTKKTWSLAIWDGFYGLPWLLWRGPIVFYRTLKDVFAIYHMIKGFNNGYVIYGVLSGEK